MLNSPLTVVEAPMGYGKTEAVKEFVRTFPVRAIWTSATQASPEFFWPDFCRELAQEAPEARDASAALEALGFPHDLVQRSAALKLLRQLSFTQKTFLIFDDCHFLPRSFIDFCESLDGERLHNLHVVCITRHAWASSKELLYPQSHLSWMDRNVFALTPAEICDYYALHGISLNPEEADKLHASTEGWISALRLGLSWCKTTGSFSSFPTDIAIHMKEAIHRMVYAPLSAEAKDLLFAIAPLERFTAAQASRLYMNDVVPLLEELTCKNAFVVFHPKSKIYSVHAIFRQFLLELFEDDSLLPPERRRDIYRACGDMFMEANEPASAMDAWHKAKNFERALTVLESDMSRHPITERANFYFTMFQDCPEDILERHVGASFKYAIAAFSAGDFPAFGARMAWLAKRCAAMPPGKDADHWRGELHVLHALAEFNDIEAMSRHHKMA
ncbi:MAG: hypothetical protein LBV29_03540, partial [Azoarcus sp.]|nr:hypothetical protein [Azoarcus sp.]